MAGDGIANLSSMLDVMERDRNIDCIALELFPVIRPMSHSIEAADTILDRVSAFGHGAGKPFLVIVTAAYSDALASETRHKLLTRGVAVFASFESAARTLRRLAEYHRFRREQSLN
jgi:acyl-CoA synthetase (NDP forming)